MTKELAVVLAIYSGARAAKEPGTAQSGWNELAIRTTEHLRERKRRAGADDFENLERKKVSKQGASATYATRPSSFRDRIRVVDRGDSTLTMWRGRLKKRERKREKDRDRKNAI